MAIHYGIEAVLSSKSGWMREHNNDTQGRLKEQAETPTAVVELADPELSNGPEHRANIGLRPITKFVEATFDSSDLSDDSDSSEVVEYSEDSDSGSESESEAEKPKAAAPKKAVPVKAALKKATPKKAASGSKFSLHFRLSPDAQFQCESLSFLVLVDGKIVYFRNYKTEDLMGVEKFQVVKYVDPVRWAGQTRYDRTKLTLGNISNTSTVQLKVFRMNESSYGTGSRQLKGEDKIFDHGQLISATNRLAANQTRRYLIVDRDLDLDQDYASCANFLDSFEFPWSTITWYYRSRDLLERLLIAPRSPCLPHFKLLSDPALFPDVDMVTPISDTNLINGLSLVEIDNLAFKHLDRFEFHSLTRGELKERLQLYNKYLNYGKTKGWRTELCVKLQMKEEILARIHSRTLAVLVCMHEQNLWEDPSGYAIAAKRTPAVVLVSDDTLVGRAQLREYALRQVESIPVLDQLLKDRYPEWNLIEIGYQEAKDLGAKYYMEKFYLRARAQIVRSIAEEHLVELQDTREAKNEAQKEDGDGVKAWIKEAIKEAMAVDEMDEYRMGIADDLPMASHNLLLGSCDEILNCRSPYFNHTWSGL